MMADAVLNAVECKKLELFEKNREKAYDQISGYMDRLGVSQGWLVVFDSDFSRPWEEKIRQKDVLWKEKRVHVVYC